MAAERPSDPALEAARYRVDRDEAERKGAGAPAPLGDVAELSARAEERDQEEQRAERRRRDRAATQHLWVERRLDEAFARGDFDHLPGAGKPIPGLTSGDPDWWVRSLVERERLTDVVPLSVTLRREDGALDAALDRMARAEDVREAVEEFNARIRSARCAPPAGPPLVTPERDVDAEVARWRSRRSG